MMHGQKNMKLELACIAVYSVEILLMMDSGPARNM